MPLAAPTSGRAIAAVSIVLTASLLATATGGARQASPPQFRTRVDLIQLDVSVIDKDHQPVRGLTAADFTVLENGQKQAVQAFAAIDLPDNPPETAGWMRDVAPDVTSNTGVEEDRLVVIVMDDYAEDVGKDLWAQRSAKEIGRGVVERLGPRDLAAIVYTVASRNNQEFTHDRARLLAAIERFNPAANAPQMSVARVLEGVCEVLGSVPQRRKVLVWVSPGIVPPRSSLVAFIHAAQLANVNVYPIDPAGIRPPTTDSPQPGVAGGDTTGGDTFRANTERMNGIVRLAALQDTLFGTAAQTGGHAFQWNEFKKSLTQVFRETGSFYLLGYVSSNTTPDGKLRRLEVKVSRRGATVNARSGNWPEPTPDAQRVAPASPAVEALSGLVPVRGVPVRIAAAPFATADVPGVAVALGLTAPPDGSDDVDIVLKAFTFDGELKQTRTLQAHVEARTSAAGPDSQTQIVDRLDLAPGRYQLRAAVTSVRRQTSGSVYADLDVPDFAKEPLSLSGLIVNDGRSPGAAPAEVIRRWLPVVPTTSRTFAQAAAVTSFIEVYQGGRNPVQPVTLTVSIRNAAEQAVFSQVNTIDVGRFDAQRRAQHGQVLPLGTLKPGEYLLTVEVSAGKLAARRDLRFAVR